MMQFTKKKLLIGLAVLTLLVSIPLTISMLSQNTDTRSRAAGSTTIYFEPESTSSAPIQVGVGDTISLDMYVEPGENLVTFIRYQVTFDDDKVELDPNEPFTLNEAVFGNVEGPVTANGSIAQSVSIGSDPTKAIQEKTKIGTLNLKAKAETDINPTVLAFGTLTQALSSAPGDQASQNVLSATSPAYVMISGTGTPQPTTSGPTLIPTPPVDGTAVNFTLLLHGVGAAGDNPNPSGNSLSNKNPLHPQRNVYVEIYDINNQVVASGSAPVTFTADGTFVGAVGLGSDVPSGNYNVKVTTDRYLRRLVPGIHQIEADKVNELPETQMIAGDTNGDNFLNVLDYNALLDCGYGLLEPLPMADANAPYNSQECQIHTPAENVDIDDNGYINSFDYNLFLRELSVQNGD